MLDSPDRNMWTDGLAAALRQVRETAASAGTLGEPGERLKIAGIEAVIEEDGGLHLYPGRTEWGAGLVVGSEILCYRRLPSTNDRTRLIVESNGPSGLVVLAEEQSGGRGRHGRVWHSPAGLGLYFSVLLRPSISSDHLGWVTLSAALALARAARLLGASLGIKWPNDVECDGKKLGGLLAEAIYEADRLKAIVLGVGVNIDWEPDRLPEEVRERATALSCCTPATVDPDALMASWLWEADTLFRELDEQEVEGTPPLASEVMARMTHIGEFVRIKSGEGIVEGICTGLSAEGFLELDGGRMVTSGELVSPAGGKK